MYEVVAHAVLRLLLFGSLNRAMRRKLCISCRPTCLRTPDQVPHTLRVVASMLLVRMRIKLTSFSVFPKNM